MRKGNNGIKWGFSLLYILFGAFMIIGLLYLSKDIEREYFPVIKDFDILTISEYNDGFQITGTMNKSRECEFLGLVAYVNKPQTKLLKPISVEFGDLVQQDYAELHTRAPIEQIWGPWYVTVPYDYEKTHIDFYAHHRCHSFYMTFAKIASFNVIKDDNRQYSIEQL